MMMMHAVFLAILTSCIDLLVHACCWAVGDGDGTICGLFLSTTNHNKPWSTILWQGVSRPHSW